MLKRCLLLATLTVCSLQNSLFSSTIAEEKRGFFDFFLPKKEENTTPKLYNLVVIGCIRSGTTYTKKLFSKLELPITEETSKFDYLVSWTMGDDIVAIHARKSVPCSDYANVFHQVRNPLKTISSLYANFPQLKRGIWPFVRAHVPEIKEEDDLLTSCAKYYYYWNKKCEERATFRFQIEQIEKAAPEFEKDAGITIAPEAFDGISKTSGHHVEVVHSFTWKDLEESLPKDLVKNLKAQAKEYGYPTK